jgi:hypothetical protein
MVDHIVEGKPVWELDANGSPVKSPGGTKKCRKIKWSTQKTVKSQVSCTCTYA